MIHKILVTFFLLSATFFASAQYTLTGKITDAQSDALPGATVAVLNANDSSIVTGTVTQADGAFKIEKLKPQLYLIKISYLGYTDNFKKQILYNAFVF